MIKELYDRYRDYLESAEREFGIEPAAVLAVYMAESNGRSFYDGRLVIRFEVHKFYRAWGRYNKAEFAKHFRPRSTTMWKGHKYRRSEKDSWRYIHATGSLRDQVREWEAFEIASRISDTETAARCISMGGPQIMGFNFSLLGYSSASGMLADFSRDEIHHIEGFLRFCKQAKLVPHIQARDWYRFARGYNGSGQAEYYSSVIHRNYLTARAVVAGNDS